MEYFVGCYAKVTANLSANKTSVYYKEDVFDSFIVDGPDVVHDQWNLDVLVMNAKDKMESKYGSIEKKDFTLMSFTRMLPEESSSN